MRQIRNVPNEQAVPGHSLRMEYGWIVDVLELPDEENEHYVVAVQRERSNFPSEMSTAIIPLEQTAEELASLYGAPEDLIGRRVRIEYAGISIREGICRVVHSGRPERRRGTTEVENRGFRYAVPGRVE